MQKKVQVKSCWNAALNAITIKNYSEKQLRQKLAKLAYSETEIAEALVKCIEYNFVNDELFAERKAISLIKEKKYANWLIKKKLFEAGIEQALIEKTLEKISENISVDAQAQRANDLFVKKFPKGVVDLKQKQKAVRYLMSHGYMWDIIEVVLEKCVTLGEN